MRKLADEVSETYGKVSKGFLVEFKSGHIGMVQRDIGSRSQSNITARGYRRWEPNESLVTMNRPSASSMGRAVWERTVADKAEESLLRETERRLQEVVARAAARRK